MKIRYFHRRERLKCRTSKQGGGFDIVIGNPPYINVELLEEKLKKFLFNNYKTCKGRTDIYIAFVEKSIELLNSNGVNLFIIPYSFTNQNYAEPLRRMLVTSHSVDEILDTSNYFVFENANVKNIILRISKKKGEETMVKIAKQKENFKLDNFELRKIKTENFALLNNCRFETKDFEAYLSLKDKIEKDTIKFEDIFLVAYGVRVNHKTDSQKPKSFYVSDEQKDGYKKFTEGRNIERYHYSQNGWLNYCPQEHYNPMFPELFENKKIMFINVVSTRIRFAYDNNKVYNSHTVINCVRIDKLKSAKHISARRALANGNVELAKNFNTLFVLGVLNSNLTNWYFMQFLSEGLHFYPDDAKQLPICITEHEQQQPIITLVNQVIEAKKDNPKADTTDLENQIDILVYKLYKLTYEEAKVIDPEIENIISKEKYDAESEKYKI